MSAPVNQPGDSKRRPVLSVCIANYNGERLLDDCVGSIYAQEFPGSVEILVHDDASTDGSLDVLASRYPTVIVIASKENVGYCKSNNRLADCARGEYLLLLNNDAALRKGALQALVDAAQSAPSPSVLTLTQYDWDTGQLVDRGVRFDFVHTPVPNRGARCGRIAYVQGACMFVRRDIWHELGGFPEWMGSNAEDAYLCALVRLRGGSILVASGSGYDHRQGTSFGGNRVDSDGLHTTYRRRYLSERNRVGMVLVCTPTWVAWPLYAVQLSMLLAEGGLVSVAKLDAKAWNRIYWPALRDSLRTLAQLRRSRREVQSGRRIGFWRYVRIFDLIPHKLAVFFRHGLPRLR